MNRDQQLKQQLECPVCMEQFETPKTLPCQHVVCLRCLQTIYNNTRRNYVKCPECRLKHNIPANGIASFPTSVTIQRLIEAMKFPNVSQSRRPTTSISNARITNAAPPYDMEEDDGIIRLIEYVKQQDKIERRCKRETNIRRMQARPRTSMQRYQGEYLVETHTYRDPVPRSNNRNLAATNPYTYQGPMDQSNFTEHMPIQENRATRNIYTPRRNIINAWSTDIIYRPQFGNTNRTPTKLYPDLVPANPYTDRAHTNTYTNRAPTNPYKNRAPTKLYPDLEHIPANY